MTVSSDAWRGKSTLNTSLQPEAAAAQMQRLMYEVKRVVVGQDAFLERVLIALLAQGHLLIEGVPGLAKTLTVNTLAKTLNGSFNRIQFTPDLLPADLVGTRIFNQQTSEFSTVLGPVFANLLLADEISPDSCRLWDLRRPEGAGGVAEPGPLADVYTELARRLGVLPSNVTHAPKPTLIN